MCLSFNCYRCCELLLLETYTIKKGERLELPGFLDIVKEVTDDSHYSMYFLSSTQSESKPTDGYI